MVTLTPISQDLCKKHLAFFQEFEQTLQSNLTEEELKQFFTITEKIKRNLE